MALPIKKSSTSESLATISGVLLSAFIIAALYFGRELLVPLALAALLTFMLGPLVSRIQRYLGRVAAVLLVVTLMMAATGAAGWILTQQTVDLANKLPDYKENIRTKLRSIQAPGYAGFNRISQTLDDLKKDIPGGNKLAVRPSAGAAREPVVQAMPVEVVNHKDQRLEIAQMILTPVLGPLGTAGLVLLLLVFMLLQREDLRNRLIRLVGQGRISATTRAMDDAGSRVSKYLLMQLVVNVTYGTAVAIGLYLIGVPNAILWGALSTVLRFIPYVGPWIAAAFPIVLSLAVSPSWTTPLLTVVLFIVLELISNNVMEPWLYGSSTGVTPIALIVAALVWTWLWGPVGLALATPLTVCLVVMGQHIPKLAFLGILLSDEEPLTPAEDCYHRLHRVGEHDEMELVDNYLKANPLSALFDSVLIPVVAAAEKDHRSGLLETEQLDFIEQGVSDILDDLNLRNDTNALEPREPAEVDFRVCCVPARAYRDQLAASMLAQQLQLCGYPVRTASTNMPLAELIQWTHEFNPHVICISAVTPTTKLHARYLCMKLRSSFPHATLIAGIWSLSAPNAETIRLLREAGADHVVSTVAEATEQLADLAPQAAVSGDIP